jgi:hypothetical protein
MTLTAAVAVATAASSAAAQYLVKEVGSFHIGGRTATLTGPVKGGVQPRPPRSRSIQTANSRSSRCGAIHQARPAKRRS